MDDITKALVDQRKEEIRQWQNTYREATAEAVNILNNEPERRLGHNPRSCRHSAKSYREYQRTSKRD